MVNYQIVKNADDGSCSIFYTANYAPYPDNIGKCKANPQTTSCTEKTGTTG